MHTSKRIILLVLVFIWSVCNCCDYLDYSSVCKGEHISVLVTFNELFDGTIFANGYNGNRNCSTPNLETSGSIEIVLNLPFLQCNTIIEEVEDKDYPQAINTITVQFHPLIKTTKDCEIIATCDIDYPLRQDFFRSYLNRDFALPVPVKSKLDIMSAEKLFGDKIAEILEVSKKQFLILNVTDGGKHKEVRIRKCYAHAEPIIDQTTNPDLLLDDNPCVLEGLIKWWNLRADKKYSDLRDYSEIQNFVLSFSQKSFYITCAFDMCLHRCTFSCFGEMETRRNRWSTVLTHEVEVFDESFNGFQKRSLDLRTSVKILYSKFLKLKARQLAQSPSSSKQRTARFDATGDVAYMKNSVSPENFTRHDESDKLINNEELSTTVYITEVSEDMSISGNQDVDKHFFENIADVVSLNISETKALERFRKRSIEETEYFDSSNDTVIIDSSKLTTFSSDGIDKSNELVSSNDSIDCTTMEDAGKILVSENLAIRSSFSNETLTFDMSSTSDFNLIVPKNGFLSAENSTEKDCVPYLKFTSVTASLGVLNGCLFLVIIVVVLFTRKERKRYNSHSKYLYNDF